MQFRGLLLLPLLGISCAHLPFLGPSMEERQRANGHFKNADTFFRNQKLDQSLQQVEKGLALEPDHYLLNQLRGRILLRKSRSDPAILEASLQQFEKVLDLRSIKDHEYKTFVGLGEAHTGLYHHHLNQARKLREEAKDPLLTQEERRAREREAKRHDRLFREHLGKAESSFRRLVSMGDGLQPALRFLFSIETDKALLVGEAEKPAQYARAIEAGLAFLKLIQERRQHFESWDIASNTVQDEMMARRGLFEYRQRERECRSLLHQLYFHAGKPAKAVEQLDVLLAADPSSSVDYFNRARCYDDLGNTAKAVRDYRDFLRLTDQRFESPRVRQAREALLRLAKR
ncbi:MAG: hypothetical protein ACE5F1_11825 [Planctomycetota bacterium]